MLIRAQFPASSPEDPDPKELANFFWNAARCLRSRADLGRYREHLFLLFFYKRLCDIDSERQYLSTNFKAEEPERESACSRPRTPTGHAWDDVLGLLAEYGRALSTNLRMLGQHDARINAILRHINLAFDNQELFPDPLLRALLSNLDQRRLGCSDVDRRTFGAACGLLIERFADEEALGQSKRPSPRGVARLLVDLVHPDPGMSVLDPVCGSGGLLLECLRHVQRSRGELVSLSLFGQEKDLATLALCNLMLVLHDVEHASIRLGDSLREPRFTEGPNQLSRFDIVLGNPPFSLPGWSDDEWDHSDPFGRGRYGCPPRSSSDYAFLLHMLASLGDEGRMAIILPCGALYRSGREARIREGLIKEGLLEAAIVLAPRLFKNTSVAVCVLFLRRGRSAERCNRVLLVNGEQEYVRGQPNQLSDENIQRLVTAVERFADEPGFCRVVTVDEIQKTGWDLRASRYVQKTGPDEQSSYRAAFSKAQLSEPGLCDSLVGGAEVDLQDVNVDLTSVVAAIRLKQAELEAARRIKASRAYEIWTKGLGGESKPHPEFIEIPACWRLVPLAEMLKSWDSLRNGMSRPLKEAGDRAHFVGQNALTQDGEIDFSLTRISTAREGTHGPFVLRNGDVLIKRVSGSLCGQAAYVRLPESTSGPAVFASGLARLRIDSAILDPLLLVSWLNHHPVYLALQKRAFGSLQKSINQPALRAFLCPVPEPDEQRRIRDELLMSANRIATISEQLTQLEQMRKRLSEAQ